MFAIGIAIAVIFYFGVKILDEPGTRRPSTPVKVAMVVCAMTAIVGCILMFISIVTLAWKYLP